jgi:hypothetical protein
MSRWEQFLTLAAQARHELVPSVNVVSAVRNRLIAARPQPVIEIDPEWIVFAAGSLVAAACSIVVSLHGWDLLLDPLVVFFQPMGDLLQ